MNLFATHAHFVYRRRWSVLVASALALAVAVAVIVRGGTLTGSDFDDTEAQRAEALVTRVIGHPSDTTFVVLFHSDTLDPRTTPFRHAIQDALAPLALDPSVVSV